jgi:hypothetical protein
MSASAALLVRTFRVGHRTVTWTVPPIAPGGVLHMACEWHPDTPRRLAPFELRAYRAARAQLMAELAVLVGGPVLTVEL